MPAGLVEFSFTGASQTSAELDIYAGYTLSLQGTVASGVIALERKPRSTTIAVGYGLVRLFNGPYEGWGFEAEEAFTYRLSSSSTFAGSLKARLSKAGDLPGQVIAPLSIAGLSDIDIAAGYGTVTRNFVAISKRVGLATSTEDFWNVGMARVLPETTAQLTINFASPSDTLAGTGARTLYVSGLDSLSVPISELINTNGSSVTTVKSYSWFQGASVVAAGSNRKAVGNIDILHGSDIQGRISAGESITFASHYKVPSGYTAFFNRLVLSTSGKKIVTLEGVVRTAAGVEIGGLNFFPIEQAFVLDFINAFPIQQKSVVYTRGFIDAGAATLQITNIYRVVPNAYVDPAISG